MLVLYEYKTSVRLTLNSNPTGRFTDDLLNFTKEEFPCASK